MQKCKNGSNWKAPPKNRCKPKGALWSGKEYFQLQGHLHWRGTIIRAFTVYTLLFSEQASGSATPTPVTPMTLRTLAEKESAERGPSPHSHHAVQEQPTETNYNSQHS